MGAVVPATQYADHQRLWPNPTVWQLAFVSIGPEFHEELEDRRDGIKHDITLKTCMVSAEGIPVAANYQGPTLYPHSWFRH